MYFFIITGRYQSATLILIPIPFLSALRVNLAFIYIYTLIIALILSNVKLTFNKIFKLKIFLFCVIKSRKISPIYGTIP